MFVLLLTIIWFRLVVVVLFACVPCVVLCMCVRLCVCVRVPCVVMCLCSMRLFWCCPSSCMHMCVVCVCVLGFVCVRVLSWVRCVGFVVELMLVVVVDCMCLHCVVVPLFSALLFALCAFGFCCVLCVRLWMCVCVLCRFGCFVLCDVLVRVCFVVFFNVLQFRDGFAFVCVGLLLVLSS